MKCFQYDRVLTKWSVSSELYAAKIKNQQLIKIQEYNSTILLWTFSYSANFVHQRSEFPYFDYVFSNYRAIDYAVLYEDLEMFTMLREKGADIGNAQQIKEHLERKQEERIKFFFG